MKVKIYIFITWLAGGAEDTNNFNFSII